MGFISHALLPPHIEGENMTSTTQQPAGTFLWKCPFCTREVRFPEGSEDYSAIFAVHHFHERHHITKEGMTSPWKRRPTSISERRRFHPAEHSAWVVASPGASHVTPGSSSPRRVNFEITSVRSRLLHVSLQRVQLWLIRAQDWRLRVQRKQVARPGYTTRTFFKASGCITTRLHLYDFH